MVKVTKIAFLAIIRSFIGFVLGIFWLYINQDYYPDSIKTIFIFILLAIIFLEIKGVWGFISEASIAVLLFNFFPSNASLIENPSIPVTYTVNSIAFINNGWFTLNGLVLYVNPQYACKATKGLVAWNIAKKMNFGGGLGGSPEDYEVTDVIPNGSGEAFAPKPNAVCMISLVDDRVPVRKFRVVTSSQGYMWSEVKS
jgi:hypothetical protein